MRLLILRQVKYDADVKLFGGDIYTYIYLMSSSFFVCLFCFVII